MTARRPTQSVRTGPVPPGCEHSDSSLGRLASAISNHQPLPADHRYVAVAQPARDEIPLGIQARLRSRTPTILGNVLARMVQGNLYYSREDFTWLSIEPRPGVYCWQATDSWMYGAARAGVHIVAIVDAPPQWAEPSPVTPPLDPSGMQNYAAFVRELLGRYGSYGSFWSRHRSLRPNPISFVDIWNEPWVHFFWHGPFPDPAGYAEMFERVVGEARPVDPSAHFMLEADLTSLTGSASQPPFLAAVLDAQPQIARDAYAISVHPYASNGWGPRVCTPGRNPAARRYQVCRIVDMRRILDAHGAQRVRIFITELGWGSYTAHSNGVSVGTVAQYVRQTFTLLRTRWKGLVSGLIWYQYQSNPSTIGRKGDFGLIEPTGVPTPGWYALQGQAKLGVGR